MKRTFTKTIATVAIITLCATHLSAAVGYTFTDAASGLNFKVTAESGTDNQVEVQGNVFYTGAPAVTIPASVTHGGKNYAVTAIGNSAFYNGDGNKVITSVSVPASVLSIGETAFRGCTNLASVTFAEGSNLNSIGKAAFMWSGITSIAIPAGVTAIEEMTFYECKQLTTVTFSGNNLLTIGYRAFRDCLELSALSIPESVTTIGGGAFYGCKKLPAAVIPAGVTTIEASTFSGCYALASVTIPAGVTSIGNDAFWYCTGLTQIICKIPDPAGVTLGTTVFGSVPTATCALEVPTGKVEAYRAAEQWKAFTNISDNLASNVPHTAANGIALTAAAGVITVENAPAGAVVEVFSLSGQAVSKTRAALATHRVPVAKGTYIVRVGKYAGKVVVSAP